MKTTLVAIVASFLSLALAACGGLQKPSYSTSVNAQTFPQTQVAPTRTPTDVPTEIPPRAGENRSFVMVSEQAGAAIANELATFFRHPSVEVQVKEFNSKKVSVFGAVGSIVRASGASIPLTGRMTIIEAIGKAGGFNANAGMDKVRVTRADGTSFGVNLFRYMQEGDPALELVLDAGDRVFVPEQVKGEERRVFLLGEVKTPGPVPYFPNLTMGQLIAQVGGWTDGALYDQAAIVRSGDGVTEIITVDLRTLLLEGDRRIDQYLKPNDVVFVPRTPIANWNAFVNQLMPTFNLINQPLYTILSIKAISTF
jgi:polysaccharide export outer membrane protein